MNIAVSLPAEDKTEWWCQMLRDLMPDWNIYPINKVPDPDAVTYSVVWRPATGAMKPFKNLKAIVSLGAGIDHVLADEQLPLHVPIIRTVGTDLTQRMKEYVAMHVLRHHRELPAIQANQAHQVWEQIVVPPATQRRVGVMGLGNLGAIAADLLKQIGFEVSGWSRSQKDLPGIKCFSGAEGFGAFLEGTEILVCLLPLTESTRGILNADTFNRLKRGASIINAARGPHLVDSDLLEGLNSGQISSATLDVFHVEPLPKSHPFWTNPKITVTPHVASLIDAPTGSKIVAKNIRTFHETGTVADLADAKRGY
ncbi:glyoxylate/hydroxypyruvate reductase A [Agrobacterium sp. SHOUNA12C]|uniref:D-2-hydroxyacid dehydrogenase protein n=1 Tax=Rhizobium rhizogenes (strain K84 / ATCC BAA-868) TaxID=311403 RepID=B9JMV2_RHIR8|nr:MULTISPECIES: glyoxylate/hydroxypyruvate reductase A [Rhizobium]ACM28883.1 D-2-hydroxyacid dehydrogenase protein [Rhizobium rhizogenes K84]MCJ9724369.1 glyoxylate/hydroxypyruvate reductase A [Agrobacterium sp. BETTINA12B]MCJ9758171.1 glyoxylate/hydroxypyruvate reductase A [Agrobacterium sp. SHOUNA12C]OCJ18860.1 glyoxylate/hydroxypyruvate reductase A [Agrobacterium sp. B131/95]EJK88175.1 phosphoglycerate dehydrogenase-like oxidoreductase [Rhizobium sp. AP16]